MDCDIGALLYDEIWAAGVYSAWAADDLLCLIKLRYGFCELSPIVEHLLSAAELSWYETRR